MQPESGNPRSRWPSRWALTLVLALIALVVGGAQARRSWRRGSGPEAARLDLLYEAWTEFNARRLDRASALLDRRAAEVAPDPLDWWLRAQIAESRGRLTEALDQLKKIPDSAPIAAQARLKAGQVELARHQARAAEVALQRALALDPNLLQANRELIYIYAHQRREAPCDAQFRALARRMSLDHVLAFAWCQNYCRIWDPRGSHEILRQFLEADPADRSSRLALATSYLLTHQLDEADATLRPLPASDPDARALRVQLALDRGAIAEANDLARDGPADHVRLNILRGQLAMLGRDPGRAVPFYRAALTRAPEDRDAIHGLGAALRQLGDPEAKKWLEISDRQDRLKRMIVNSVSTIRTDPRLFFKLGTLCQSLQRLPEARAWYRLAITRDPFDSEAQKALDRLDRASRANDPKSNSRKDLDH